MADSEGSSKPKDGWDKAQVAGQLLSGVLLAVIALVVKIGADNIASSLQTGQLVQSLITDLTTKDQQTRQDVALIALNYSVGDEKPALVCEIAERIFRDRDAANPGAPLEQNQSLGTIAFQTIERRCSERAAEIRKELLNTASQTRSQSAPDTPQAGERATAPQQLLLGRAFKKIVYIQFREEENRKLAQDLGEEFTEKGFTAPGVERVARQFPTNVRFFHAEDEALAREARDVTQTFLLKHELHSDVELKDLSNSGLKSPAGQLEVWVNFERPG